MRGRGHISQRGKDKSRWTVVIELEKVNGKRTQQSLTVRGTIGDAKKKLSELLHQQDTGTFMRPTKTTLTEFLDRWLKDYASNLSPRTSEGYEHIVIRYVIPKLGHHILAQLKPEHLQQFYTAELNAGLSAQTVRHHHMVIHKSLGNAVEWGLLSRNPADAVRPPKAQRTEMRVWNEQELRTFLEAAQDSQYYQLFSLNLFTGMRRSELLALKWSDVDLIYAQISVSRSLHVLKGGNVIFRSPKTAAGRRTIALSPSVVLMLAEYREDREHETRLLGQIISEDDLVFSNLGKNLLPNTVTHAWQKLIKRTGSKAIRFHDARHTHASLMLKAGIHPKVVQERLGHSSIAITLDTYSHVAPGLQMAAAQRFDDLVQVKHNEKATENSVSKW